MRRQIATSYGASPGQTVEIRCAYCDEQIFIEWEDRPRFLDRDRRATPELDHVIPLYHDGPHTVENLVPACLRCNRSKGPRIPARMPA